MTDVGSGKGDGGEGEGSGVQAHLSICNTVQTQVHTKSTNLYIDRLHLFKLPEQITTYLTLTYLSQFSMNLKFSIFTQRPQAKLTPDTAQNAPPPWFETGTSGISNFHWKCDPMCRQGTPVYSTLVSSVAPVPPTELWRGSAGRGERSCRFKWKAYTAKLWLHEKVGCVTRLRV